MSSEIPNVDVTQRLRAELAFWGIDTSDVSDEDIERSVRALGEAIVAFGVTMEQAGRAFAEAVRSHRHSTVYDP